MDWTPNDYEKDPYGHLTNQGAHGGLVGVGLVLVGMMAFHPLVALWVSVLAYLVVWEIVISAKINDGDIAPSWDWRDSIDDTANVAGGAATCAVPFLWIAPDVFLWAWVSAAAVFTLWALSLVYSTWRRG